MHLQHGGLRTSEGRRWPGRRGEGESLVELSELRGEEKGGDGAVEVGGVKRKGRSYVGEREGRGGRAATEDLLQGAEKVGRKVAEGSRSAAPRR